MTIQSECIKISQWYPTPSFSEEPWRRPPACVYVNHICITSPMLGGFYAFCVIPNSTLHTVRLHLPTCLLPLSYSISAWKAPSSPWQVQQIHTKSKLSARQACKPPWRSQPSGACRLNPRREETPVTNRGSSLSGSGLPVSRLSDRSLERYVKMSDHRFLRDKKYMEMLKVSPSLFLFLSQTYKRRHTMFNKNVQPLYNYRRTRNNIWLCCMKCGYLFHYKNVPCFILPRCYF